MRKTPDLYKKLIMLAGDIVLIVAGLGLAVAIRFKPMNVVDRYTGATLLVVLSFVLCYYVFDLYNPRRPCRGMDFLTHFIVAVVTATTLSVAIFYASLRWKFGRGILFLDVIFIASFTYLWRLLLERSFRPVRRKRRVLIAGAGASGRAMCAAFHDQDLYAIAGFVDDDPAKSGAEIGAYRVIGDSETMRRMAEGRQIDDIVVAVSHEKNKRLISALLGAKLMGIGVYDMETMYEHLTGKLPVSHLREGWLAYADLHGTLKSIYRVRIKRLLSLGAAVILLLVTSPVTMLAAVAIKLDSAGPVFFRQRRVGLNGAVYEVVKFRSMRQNAEKEDAVWATEGDPRVTRVGRVLRTLRIDELPQLWNVLKGEMSLVGPRPERPEFVESLQKTIPFYFIRHVVKPGITGWAQVNYRYGASREDALEKLQYDLYYVKNLSFMLDAEILLKTIRVVLFGVGSR